MSNRRASLDEAEHILLLRLNLLKVEAMEKGMGVVDREDEGVVGDGVEAPMGDNQENRAGRRN